MNLTELEQLAKDAQPDLILDGDLFRKCRTVTIEQKDILNLIALLREMREALEIAVAYNRDNDLHEFNAGTNALAKYKEMMK
jgi:hypothetical protein